MSIEVTFLIIAVVIAAIWLLFGFKRAKHKFLALFLIGLILLSFFSFGVAFKGKDISINNISDLGKVLRIYFSWLGTVFGNMRAITGNVIEMDWKGNETT